MEELGGLLELLQKHGVTFYKSHRLELHIHPQSPPLPQTQKLKEDVTALAKMNDLDLLNRLFPEPEK